MAAVNTTTSAEGIAKRVHGRLKDLRPDSSKAPLQRDIPFNSREKLGEEFSETLLLTDEAGATYGGSDANLFALNESVAAESKRVTASGCEVVMRGQIAMKAITTAMGQGEPAFESMWGRFMSNLKNSCGKRVDISLMHGGDDIGVIDSVSGSSGTRTWTLTTASWLPLAWLGAKNAPLDIYNAALSVKRNLTTNVVITSVLPKTYQLNVSGLEAELATCVSTDRIFYKGAKDEECDGLLKIAGLEAGESYLGLPVNSYPDMWAGNVKDVSGALDFDTVQTELMEVMARGGAVSKYRLYCSHPTWNSLSSEMDALRALDSSYSSDKNTLGQKRIEYHTGGGTVEIVATLNMKLGQAVACPVPMEGDISRKGSIDVDFMLPNLGQRYFHVLPNDHGVEARCFSDQFFWSTEQKSMIHFFGIAN